MKKVYIPINPCLLAFDIDFVSRELKLFCDTYPELPLVSVGSGFGYLERECFKLLEKKKEFILIDPAPDSFNPSLPVGHKQDSREVKREYGLEPDYPLLKDVFVTRPQLFIGNNSLLLLNWSDYGDHSYDLGALLQLRPRAIFLITHKGESANSKAFHSYMKESERYFCLKRFLIRPSQQESERNYCRENHLEYAIEWLVDTTFVTCDYIRIEEEILCQSNQHKDAPVREMLKDLMKFAFSLSLREDDK